MYVASCSQELSAVTLDGTCMAQPSCQQIVFPIRSKTGDGCQIVIPKGKELANLREKDVEPEKVERD